MAENNVIEMNHITMSFSGNKVLDDVHFELRAGEIHSLVGQNGAGKSTLIKILNGIYKPVSGEILIDGKPANIKSPRDVQAYGMEFVHQELNVCEYLSVAENIYMGNLPRTKLGLVDYVQMIEQTKGLLEEVGVDIDPTKQLRKLRNAEKQIVEIMKALTRNSRIIVMDEPTSSLNQRERENFFRIVRNLRSKKISIVFISHFIEDVIELSDRVTVIKDGHNNGSFVRGSFDKDTLIEAMMGRKIHDVSIREEYTSQERRPVVLEVRNLCRRNKLNNISFKLEKGRIVGVCGLLGAGKTEIARAIYGLDEFDSGEIIINNETITHPTPDGMMRRKVVLLTEDRKKEGYVPLLSVRENTTLSVLQRLSKRGLIDQKKQVTLVESLSNQMQVKCSSIEQPVVSLSGGNQQKVIISRCLASEPEVFMLDEPTRGVDIGAKSEIYRILKEVAAQGMAVLVFSSELEELLINCSDIFILKRGEIVGCVSAQDLTKNDLLKMIG